MADKNQNFPVEGTSSSEEVRAFFDKYFLHQITFPTNQIDAVFGYFLKRGFDEAAARSVSKFSSCRSTKRMQRKNFLLRV